MKICFYSNDDKILTSQELKTEGGSGTLSSMLYVAEGLTDKFVNVSVLGRFTKTKTIEGIRYTNIDEIDCVYSYSSSFDVFVYVGHCGVEITRRLEAKKIIYWAHNWLDSKKYFLLLKKNVIDNIVYVGYYQLYQSIISGIKDRTLPIAILNKLIVVPNPIDTLTLSKLQIKKTFSNIGGRTLNIAFVGFPSKNKGFDKACELVSVLVNEGTIDVKFHVFGGADLYNLNEHIIDDNLFSGINAIESYTHRYGSIGRLELYEKISEFDLVVSGLNGSETFCLSLMEACALGVPVITCDVGGQVEFLSHGDNAYVLPFRKPVSLLDVNGILSFIEGYDYNNKSNSYIRNTYSINKVADRWLKILTGKRLLGYKIARFRAFRSILFFVFTVILRR